MVNPLPYGRACFWLGKVAFQQLETMPAGQPLGFIVCAAALNIACKNINEVSQ